MTSTDLAALSAAILLSVLTLEAVLVGAFFGGFVLAGAAVVAQAIVLVGYAALDTSSTSELDASAGASQGDHA